MRYIIIGQVLDKNGELITKVLSYNCFELPSTKVLRKYVKEILANHVSKLIVKEIMTKPEGSKDEYRLIAPADDECLSHTIVKAEPGLLYGTNKKIIARIWVQRMDEDILPKKFADLQN